MKVETVLQTGRNFKILHQVLSIFGIDFERRSLQGFTEIAFVPLIADLTEIKLNCKQCDIIRATFNESHDAEFEHEDLLKKGFLQENKRDLDVFVTKQSQIVHDVDPDNGGGELVIKIPAAFEEIVKEQKLIRLGIEFALENPQAGFRFVNPSSEGSFRERGCHLFSIKSENSSRLWFPCVDSYSELCTWKLEITVDTTLTAVASGELLDTYYSTDMRRRTFHYHVAVPTAAPNIGLAVGAFEIFVHPEMHEITHFGLPGLRGVLKHSVSTLDKPYEFFEELLSVRFPYGSYKQVFLDQSEAHLSSYVSLTILSTNLLFNKGIIDDVQTSRTVMAHGVAQQFFGVFVSPLSWSDAWLTKGVAAYITGLFVQRYFGNNEYMHQINKLCAEVTQYEEAWGAIALQPKQRPHQKPDPQAPASTSEATSKATGQSPSHRLRSADAPSVDNETTEASPTSPSGSSDIHFDPSSPHTCSPLYLALLGKKAHIIMRLIEKKLGRDMLCQVFNQLISVTNNASQPKYDPVAWHSMLLSFSSFIRCVSSVTGQDLCEFAEQWINAAGHAKFDVSFVFNRKRNLIEMDIRQDTSLKGVMKYTGPIMISVQELDGSFNHTIQIDDVDSHHEIGCHSKARRQKKRKIPLWTGEEVDMDLSQLDPDSPVLWIRFDPELKTLRSVNLRQPDYHWQYQLKFEKDVIAQLHALEKIPEFPSPHSRFALMETIENDHLFYGVRTQACFALTDIANKLSSSWTGPPALLTFFQKYFGSRSAPRIVKPNNFSNFQQYYLQCVIPQAMSKLRTPAGNCPQEVQQFLLDLLKYNDNTLNQYSDDYYRAAVLTALGSSVTPSLGGSSYTRAFGMGFESTYDVQLTAAEIIHHMNLDKLVPSYKCVVTVSCLRALSKLCLTGHMVQNAPMFLSYAEPHHFWDVRAAAIDCVTEQIKRFQDLDLLLILLDKISSDFEDLSFRYHMALSLVRNPPFLVSDRRSQLNTGAVAETMWSLMAMKFPHDSRLRCLLADLYFMMYGRKRPYCLGPDEDEEIMDSPSQEYEDDDDRRRSASPMQDADTNQESPPVEEQMDESLVDEEYETKPVTVEDVTESPVEPAVEPVPSRPASPEIIDISEGSRASPDKSATGGGGLSCSSSDDESKDNQHSSRKRVKTEDDF